MIDTPRQPQLIVVDSELRTPVSAQLFMPDRALYIYTASDDAEKTAALEERGACVIRLPDSDGMVDLVAMARDLARREINELHVEAGQTLNGALIRHGLVDELLMYIAPKLIGQGRDVARFGPLENLSQSLDFEYKSIGPIGPDLRIVARACGRDHF
jgi:diaminohydroxyphosphoribosylaminopyrimidine deaminase/5-amino-6-(5-phosphoribosylamino)uracil reductase